MNSEEYENLARKLIDLDSQLKMLETSFKGLETQMNSLRGWMNRRVGGKMNEEEETQSLNSGGDLALRGSIGL